MQHYRPIFMEADTPVDLLLQQVGTQGWRAKSTDVGVIQAAHAIDGEMWAPQLTPYNEWKPRGDGKQQEGHDGDLYTVGSLRMGITDELRERMVAIGLEAARKMAEQSDAADDPEQTDIVDPDVIDLPLVFGVKEGAEGFVLCKVDLRQYAKRSGRDGNLVVVLPSHVEGVPVTRIDADAFSRFNVRGVGVRLLVVPDTVRSVDAKAFSYLAAESIYLGRDCTGLGSQPLERWALKPAIEHREYLVSHDNEWWQSQRGSVLSKDGADLLFLAPPYGERVELPGGCVRVGTDAFAKWDTVPQVVVCGSHLERVSSKLWDGALWLCPQSAPAAEALQRRNVRLASHNVVTEGGCWYDFDAQGAFLVAGPPPPPSVSQTFAHAAAANVKEPSGSASQHSAAALAKQAAHAKSPAEVLSLPRSVQGCAVSRIAPRALATAPDTVVLPEGLEAVGHDNACKGTHHLVLPQTLKRIDAHSFCSRELHGIVSIPASVVSIGEGCFEYAICRLEHTGVVVHVSANQLLSCFIERTDEEVKALAGSDPATLMPFDLGRYDELLCQGQNLPQRIGALVHRLATPSGISQRVRDNIVAQLRAETEEAMLFVAREGDAATVASLMDAGFIDDDTFEEQIELLRRANRTDCVMLMMDRHRAQHQQAASARSRFAL